MLIIIILNANFNEYVAVAFEQRVEKMLWLQMVIQEIM